MAKNSASDTELDCGSGDGIAAALKFTSSQATAALRPKILETDKEPDGHYYLLENDGSAKLVTAKPDWHSEALETPAELAAFIKAEKVARSAIFYNENRIVFVRDLNDRRDMATCELKTSPQWDWLKSQSGQPMNQVSLVRLLRVVFRSCFNPDLLIVLRKVKFVSGSITSGEKQTDRESFSREITAASEVQLPDDFSLNIPVFENFRQPAAVECALEVDPSTPNFKITPYPQQMRKAMDATLKDIREEFADKEMPPIYFGNP